MDNFSEESLTDVLMVNFGCIPVDTYAEKYIYITNYTEKPQTYRVSLTYILNNIDHVFNISVPSTLISPGDNCDVRIMFKPNVVGQSFTDYYIIDDTAGNTYRMNVTGRCFGPEVSLSKRTLRFRIVKYVNDQNRKDTISMINTTAVDTVYQWLLPVAGHSNFRITTGNCGVIKAFESITTTIMFNGVALGLYTAELVCLVLNQEPLFLNVLASVELQGSPKANLHDHTYDKCWSKKSRSMHLMENSLNRLGYIPGASIFDRYLDFGSGSVDDSTKNISQTLCVTNHEEKDGYIQWISDPDSIFIIDPVASVISPDESKLFTIRFRPKEGNEAYGYILCGDYQYKTVVDGKVKYKHTIFRIPCLGNTWYPCSEWESEWECPTQVVLPPTVPCRTAFTNFMLSNLLEIPMTFKFNAPQETNFVVLPMCGIVPGRGWQIINVALEPKSMGDFFETWDLVINQVHKTRITMAGSAETSELDIMSHGYNPATDAMYEFPPTITGAVNYCTAYIHNITRMEIHMRIINTVDWLGADNGGTMIIPPKEILKYHWWFFPKVPNMLYDTTVTCSSVCLIEGRPVGETKELFVHLYGYSEYPNMKFIPKRNNMHDLVVGQTASITLTLYNFGTCYFTSKLYWLMKGMDDDWSTDRVQIDCPVNSLKPNKFCPVTFTIMPNGAGPRQVDIKYTVLFRTEYDEIEEIQPVTKTICKIWYDGIYPTFKIKRVISVKCPIILSNHDIWNILNVDDVNRALDECRPNEPLRTTLYAPDLSLNCANVELILIIDSLYDAPVPFTLRRQKLCECEMVEVQVGISTFTMRHTCIHRPLVELTPMSGTVVKGQPVMLRLTLSYTLAGLNTLCYVLTLPNQRSIHIFINIMADDRSRSILIPLRRIIDKPEYLAILDCGKVPINNLYPVVRITWLYNPTEVFATWRLLRACNVNLNSVIKCLLFFAEVPPLGKIAIPFSFMPTEMIDYDATFSCSFGYETEKIRVIGQGGLPNCIETRPDMPPYVERDIRAMNRSDVVYLSAESMVIPSMSTHSLSRDVIAINNETDHVMRFIWLPERISNIVNIVMTPCWGVIQPKTSEWITMTVYFLQEPATFTTTLSCELLDLTNRRLYQRNELLRRSKKDKCNQNFIITEHGHFHPNINDSPPYVLDIEKPKPTYISMSVAINSKGQRDGYQRQNLYKMWEETPPYDLSSSDLNMHGNKSNATNNMTLPDILRCIDTLLWDALHGKMFKDQLEYYASEEVPTYPQLLQKISSTKTPILSRRVTSGICDAIVNKAVFNVYGLNPKHDSTYILEAEEE